MAFLALMNGPRAGQQFELVELVSILGRHRECQVWLDDPEVNLRQVILTRDGREFYIQALSSRRLTLLNQQPIPGRQRIRDGDELRVGGWLLTFHDPEEAATARGAPRSPARDASSPPESSPPERASPARASDSAEARLAFLVETIRRCCGREPLGGLLPQALDGLLGAIAAADRGLALVKNEFGQLTVDSARWRHQGPDDRVRAPTVIANCALDGGLAIFSDDAAADPRFDWRQSEEAPLPGGVVCAPILDVTGLGLGALQLDTMQRGAGIRRGDVDLVQAAASQIGIAMSVARLQESASKYRTLELELQLVAQLQSSLLPSAGPEIAGYEFYDYYRPTHWIGGGDYFDYALLADGRLAILIADIAGHGLSSSYLAARLSGAFRVCLIEASHPAEAARRLNSLWCELSHDRFVTMVLAVLDYNSHRLTLVNAGHLAPMVRRADGRLEEFHDSGLPLGLVADAEFPETEFGLEALDSVVLLTDGIVEATNAGGESYGGVRLKHFLSGGADSPRQLGATLIEDLFDFVQSHPIGDDMCALIFGRRC